MTFPISLRGKSSIPLIIPVFFAMTFLPKWNAEALAPLFEGGIFVHFEGIASYDTNLFANANQEDDFYVTVIPAVQYLRETGELNLEIQAGVEVIRFIDFTDQDTEDFFSSIELSYPNRPGFNPRRIHFEIGWRQRSRTNEVLGDRTRSDILYTTLRGRNHVSDRLALRGFFNYRNEQFHQGNLSETDTFIVAADLVHVYSEHLETFLGYRFRYTTTAGTADRSLDIYDNLVQIGAEGQLRPRTVGTVSVGVQNRSFGSGGMGDALRPYGAAAITWTPRYRSEFIIEGTKDFAVTPDDRSIDRTGVRATLDQGVYRGFSLEPFVGYTNVRISRSGGGGRRDDLYETGIGFVYVLASGASTALRYSYRDQHSSDAFFEHDRHLVELSGRISF